ncbi:hypothetical protein NG726_28500 [Pseudomonas sp. MOB-449]|nr:hypothetical protein [Pseudomonas sp. MOB-449]
MTLSISHLNLETISRIDLMHGNTDDQRSDEQWADIQDIIHEESKRSLKRQERKKRPKWMSEETLKLALEHGVAKVNERNDEVKQLNKRFQKAAQEDKVKYYIMKCAKTWSQKTKREVHTWHFSS